MDFFEHQEQARKRTGQLVLFFVAALVTLILITFFLVASALMLLEGAEFSGLEAHTQALTSYYSWEMLAFIALGIGLIALLASLFKMAQLKGGGRVVAESLGGRLVLSNSDHGQERRLLNIVEEMAIASGMPVPSVYLLEEQGINAFAAGWSPADAVIGVTRGCMELLDRHELQGVIAHEFSHILNGDMRLNIRLIGVLHGILVIGILGRQMLRSLSRSGYRGRGGKNNGALPFYAVGAGLMLVGYAGTFFGSLIKAAVSRQREYLADAAAVQFTRNPEGIANALKKIGGVTQASYLEQSNVSEFSHLFFGQAYQPFLGALMATHPPLPERIRRIDPYWDGRYPIQVAPVPAEDVSDSQTHRAAGVTAGVVGALSQADQLVAATGQIDPDQLEQSRTRKAQLPDTLLQATQDPLAAVALAYSLLVDSNAEVAVSQWQMLRQNESEPVHAMARSFATAYGADPQMRFILLELSLPALRQLSPQQWLRVKTNLSALIKADQQVTLFEWSLYRILIHALEPRFQEQMLGGSVKSYRALGKAIGLVFSAVAEAGADSEVQAKAAFTAACQSLGLSARLHYIPPANYQLRDLSRALSALNHLRPLLKPGLLKALCCCVTQDNQIKPLEVQLVRAISDALDCPMPPLAQTHQGTRSNLTSQ